MDAASIAEKDTRGSSIRSNDVFEVDETSYFNMPLFILWFCAVIALSATVFFWLMGYSSEQDLRDKKTSLSEVVSTITSPSYVDIEKKATSFKSAVSELSRAQKTGFSVTDFIPRVYSRINKDVVIASIAINDEGNLNIVGQTDSYRSAAEQLLSLEEWKVDGKTVLSDVQLGSVSLSTSEDGKITVPISITAKFDRTINFKQIATDKDSDNEEGGDSEKE